MPPQKDLYAQAFFDLFKTYWPEFWRSDERPGNWNQEERFKRYLMREGDMNFGANRIQPELRLRKTTQQRRRSIDYVLIPSTVAAKWPPLSSVLATCEVKAPARPTIWRYSANWFEPLRKDVEKQYQRASEYPRVEHYVLFIAWMDNAKRKSKV